MRAFVVTCLVALATADKLGYNYKPVSHSDSGLSFSPGTSSSGIPSGIGDGLSSLSGGLGSLGGLSGGSSGSFDSSSSGLSDSLSGSIGNLGSSGGTSSGLDSSSDSSSDGAPGEVSYEKEFFTFAADESDFNEPKANDQAVNSVKKSIRVIFIKGPENNGLENAVLGVAKHASEQQTAIYVLQKQTDLGELANKLQSSHDIQSQKPEVHFVKYRTPEDAANAQKSIQAQYDQLGGTSQSHDGGAVSVHNFASPADHNVGDSDAIAGPGGIIGPEGSISGVLSIAAPKGTYLPPSILRSLRL